MEIVYVAHTRSGVFMLDELGVCRWAVAVPGRTQEKVPERIVGSQYMATLDLESEGGLVDFPKVGCPMLFAATDDGGRVRLVRTPPVLRFEDRRNGTVRPPLGRTPSMPPEEELTPVSMPSRTSSIPPPMTKRPSSIPPAPPLPFGSEREALMRPRFSTIPPPASEALPLPLVKRTPLPPPPRARIVARIPPPPTLPMLTSQSNSGIQSIPVRVRATTTSAKKLAHAK